MPALSVVQPLDGLHTEIFAGFSSSEILRISRCLGTRSKKLQCGDVLTREGECLTHVGIVAEGTLLSRSSDSEGATYLLDVVGRGDVFGEDLLWDAEHHTHRTVTAATDATVLLLGMDRIYNSNGPLCDLRLRMVENLFKVVNEKNRKTERHLQLMLRKSLRERLSLFLQDQAASHGSTMFTIPLSRNELAEYLNVDRTALSRELSRMKKEGLIDYYRNSFNLIGL